MADMEQDHTQPEAPANTQNLVDLGITAINNPKNPPAMEPRFSGRGIFL